MRYGEYIVIVPGLYSVAGHLTVHIGTWENHTVPRLSFQQAEEARRRYGGMVVGLTHIRGVVRVMPDEPESQGHSKGLAVIRKGMRRPQPYPEMEVLTLTKLALISERARRERRFQFTSLAHLLDEEFLAACYDRLGRDRASGIDGVTWKAYGEHLDENLCDLVSRLKRKRYNRCRQNASIYRRIRIRNDRLVYLHWKTR